MVARNVGNAGNPPENLGMTSAQVQQIVSEAMASGARTYLPITSPTYTVTSADGARILTNKGNGGNCVLSINPTGMVEANTLLIFEVVEARTITIQGAGGFTVRFLNAGEAPVTSISSGLQSARLSIRYAGTQFGGTSDFNILINDGFGA